jgi:WD40 repeat protein
MATFAWKELHSLVVVCLLAGCGQGLTHSLSVDNGDSGVTQSDGPVYTTVDPPSLGDYAQPCSVIGNSQRMLSSFSPTADVVALASGPGHIAMHATSDGHLVGGFDAHLGPVTAMAFSPKEALLATGGLNGALKLWRDGVLVAQGRPFSRSIESLVWSHDGLSLAAATSEGPIALFDVQGNAMNLRWSDDRVYRGVFFTPNDEMIIASYLSDPTPGFTSGSRLFRVSDGAELESGIYFLGQEQSPDGSLIAYATNTALGPVGTVAFGRLTVVGETLSVNVLWERGFQTSAPSLVFSADSKEVVMWGYGDTKPAKLYDVEDGNLVATLAWADDTIQGLTFSPDGRFALVLDSEARGGAARLVDLASGTSISVATQPPRSQSLGALAKVSADSTVMASQLYLSANANDTAVGIWDLTKLQMTGQIAWPNATEWPNLSAKGDLLYGGLYTVQPGTNTSYSYDGLKIQSVTDPSNSTTLPASAFSGGTSVTLASDGRTLAAAVGLQSGWAIYLYDRIGGTYTSNFSIGDRYPASLRFSPDGTRLLVSSDSWGSSATIKGISMWRVRDGQLLWQGSSRTESIQSAAFSQDGSLLVLVGGGPHYDSSNALDDSPGVDIYDAGNGTWLRTLDTAYGSRASVRFSPDGQLLMVPTSLVGIEIWRTADWQRYNTFGYSGGSDAIFLPQGKGVLEISTGVVWCTAFPPRTNL